MEPVGLSANAVALELRVTPTGIGDIIKGRREIFTGRHRAVCQDACGLGGYFHNRGNKVWQSENNGGDNTPLD